MTEDTRQIRISFIIPVLNGERTIGMCLDAIRSLDHPVDRIEIIVVDNGSSDRTVKIASEAGARVLVERGSTVGQLRNVGAANSDGEYLAFIDADCELPAAWARDAVACLAREGVGMAGAKMYRFPEDAVWWKKAWSACSETVIEPDKAKWAMGGAIMVKRSVFNEVGGFDETLVTCEDVQFGYAVSSRYEIVCLKSLIPTHYDSTGTIRVFFRKELWRSRDNFRVMLRNLREPAELKIAAVLAYYLGLTAALIPCMVLFFISGSWSYLFLWVLAVIIPVLAMTARVCARRGDWSMFLGIFAVYSVYLAAKLGAIFKNGK